MLSHGGILSVLPHCDRVPICSTGDGNLYEGMYKATGKNTVVLLDEYDVPVENTYFRGFYRDMVDFIRTFLKLG